MAAQLPEAAAQQGQEWFVPGGGHQQQQQRPAQRQPRNAPRRASLRPRNGARPERCPSDPGPAARGGPDSGRALRASARARSCLRFTKGPAPPAAVIGVLGVPEIMRACVAAQEVERMIGQRRQRLSEDAQKEQASWRELQQQLGSQRSGLSPEQIRDKERELQERITNAQRQFRERNRVIQEATQYALAQIERTLVAVIRQVAESRGMNLVLHRNQVALNVNEFDLTDQVALS